MKVFNEIFDLTQREEKLLEELNQKKEFLLIKTRRAGFSTRLQDFISLQQKINGLEMAKKMRAVQEAYDAVWIKLEKMLEEQNKSIKGL